MVEEKVTMFLRLKSVAILSVVLFLSIACATLTNAPTPESSLPLTEPPPVNLPVVTDTPAATETPAPLTCPVVTDKIIEVSMQESESEEELLDEDVYLVTYAVSGDEISDPYYEEVSADLKDEQGDADKHQQVWEYFTALIPAEQREVIGEYSIMTDGKDGGLAAVAQTMDDPYTWSLEVDIADSADYYSLTFTLIHEFGHLLTLGPDQVPPNLDVFEYPDDNDIYLEAVSQCPQYFPGEGCANADSYINAYYNQFWTEIHAEWNDINLEEDEDAYYARLDEFYYKYEDQFLTSYSATNPEEDIAEAWSFFILAPKPAGDTIAEQKILFFYEYPELVQLRAEILNNLCGVFPE